MKYFISLLSELGLRNIVVMLLLFSISFGAIPQYSKSPADCSKMLSVSTLSMILVERAVLPNLLQIMMLTCEQVEKHKIDEKKATEIIQTLAKRLSACRNNDSNPLYVKFLKEQNIPDTTLLAVKRFCVSTFDRSDKLLGVKKSGLLENGRLLKIEFFCTLTREFVNPSDFWANLFKPEWPSHERLEGTADKLCDDLRNGSISIEDAEYRWKVEIEEFKKQILPDALQEFLSNTLALLKLL